jgi:hypothetical protein
LTDKREGQPLVQEGYPHTNPPKPGDLILPLSASVPEILGQGKRYPWPRPHHCPRCGGLRLWGHGYVSRYFDDLTESVWMKRWRCPDCGAVHTCRPRTHWRRFLAPIAVIVSSLIGKLGTSPWGKDVSRQRQQYWWHGYRIQSQVHGFPAATVQALLDDCIVTATHSLIDRAIRPWPEPPYPRLAATGPP